MLHDRVILLTVVTEAVSRVASEERLEVTDLGAGLVRAILHHGFMEEADVLGALRALTLPGDPIDVSSVSFFVGKVIVIPSVTPEMSLWRKRLFAFMSRNSWSAVSFFRLPPNQVCELQGEVEV